MGQQDRARVRAGHIGRYSFVDQALHTPHSRNVPLGLAGIHLHRRFGINTVSRTKPTAHTLPRL